MYGTSAELVLYLIFYNTKMTVVRIKTSFRNKLTSVGVSCCYVLFICHRLLKEKVRVIDSPKNWAFGLGLLCLNLGDLRREKFCITSVVEPFHFGPAPAPAS